MPSYVRAGIRKCARIRALSIGPIDRLCNSLIDPGDVDYLNAEQCKLMLGWLEWRLTEPINPRLETIYRKLVEFANKAIELGTGIVFDL